jgi:hypothetical protein
MVLCDLFGVADPRTDDLSGELFGQFRLSCCSEVVEEAGPWGQTGFPNDAVSLSAEIAVAVSIAGDDVFNLRACRNRFPHVQQVGAEFREDRDITLSASFVVFCLAACNANAVVFPLHVRPLQREMLGRTSKSTTPLISPAGIFRLIFDILLFRA